MKEPISETKLSNFKRFLWFYRDLQKLSRQIHKLDENSCNYGLTDKQVKRQQKLIKKAESLAKEVGFKVYHQSDPRGTTLYLITEQMGSNDYNNGIPVY